MCSECFRGFLHREFHQASVLLGSHRCCDEVTEIVTAPIINVVIVIGYYYNLFMKSLPMYWETPHMWEVFPHRRVFPVYVETPHIYIYRGGDFPYLGTLSIHGGGLPICRGCFIYGERSDIWGVQCILRLLITCVPSAGFFFVFCWSDGLGCV
jgi:hypothetical protein